MLLPSHACSRVLSYYGCTGVVAYTLKVVVGPSAAVAKDIYLAESYALGRQPLLHEKTFLY